MTKPQEDKWVEEFDKEFPDDFWYWFDEGTSEDRRKNVEKVKSFISSLLSQQKADIEREIDKINTEEKFAEEVKADILSIIKSK